MRPLTKVARNTFQYLRQLSALHCMHTNGGSGLFRLLLSLDTCCRQELASSSKEKKINSRSITKSLIFDGDRSQDVLAYSCGQTRKSSSTKTFRIAAKQVGTCTDHSDLNLTAGRCPSMYCLGTPFTYLLDFLPTVPVVCFNEFWRLPTSFLLL